MKLTKCTPLLSVLLLTACSFFGGDDPEVAPEPASPPVKEAKVKENAKKEEPAVPTTDVETDNVSIMGLLEPAGITVYQEGTHKLSIDENTFMLLESDTVDLNGYVGEKATVYGAVRPTVEAGGSIMRVETIELADSADDIDSEEVSVDSPPSEDSPVEPDSPIADDAEVETNEPEQVPEEEVILEKPIEEAEPEAEEMAESDETDSMPEEAAKEEPTEEETMYTEAQEERIQSMATDDYATERWTQNYCSSHIGFCVPVHKNWWFKSFGSTANYLWHVELSNAPVENLEDGPVEINVLGGSLESIGKTDGTVELVANRSVGYRALDTNRHFEIVADTRIQAAVDYITKNISLQPSEL